MLSQSEARRLAELLSQLHELLPSSSRIAVARQVPAALSVLNACAAGRALDRQAVVVALVYLELELRQLGRATEASGGDGAERERLWSEIDSIAAGM